MVTLTIKSHQDLAHDAIVKQLGLKNWAEYQQIKKLAIVTKIGVLPDLPLGIVKLNCSFNRLKTIPDLSHLVSLVSLNCSDNELTHLPKLPPSIAKLDCSGNELTHLPDLPPGIVKLNCSDQDTPGLTNLPDLSSLIHLTELNCSFNGLTYIPELPSCLVYLYCCRNRLDKLPYLPSCLVDLNCAGNELEQLPVLPPGLVRLYCSKNSFMLEHLGSMVLPETLEDYTPGMRRLLLNQHNRRCVDLDLNPAKKLPSLGTRLDIKKRHDCWRFQLDGPEWNEAVGEMI